MQPNRSFRRRPYIASAALPHTEKEKREWLKQGKPLEFPPIPEGGVEDTDSRSHRTIKASWILELCKAPDRICGAPIRISNAIIEEPLKLHHGVFNFEFSIVNSVFDDQLDLTYAAFNRGVSLGGSHFNKGAILRAAHSKAHFRIERAIFQGESTFIDLQVEGVLVASGAIFDQVSFERIRISKNAFFRPFREKNEIHPVRFKQGARFFDARIGGNAEFDGTQFEGMADFSFLQVQGNALFRSARSDSRNVALEGDAIQIRFGGEANFRAAHIEGAGDFGGAQFEGDATFVNSYIGGGAYFGNYVYNKKNFSVYFGGEVNFSLARIQGLAEFYGAWFERRARFVGIHIAGAALFHTIFPLNKPVITTFVSEANFSESHIESSAFFQGVRFNARALFNRMTIGGNANFNFANSEKVAILTRFGGAVFYLTSIGGSFECSGAQFEEESSFELFRVKGAAIFRSTSINGAPLLTRFLKRVTFLEANFQSVDFDGVQFHGDSNFSRMKVANIAFFRSVRSTDGAVQARFYREAKFIETQVQGSAHFINTGFHGPAVFNRFRVNGDIFFNEADFQQADFFGAHFEGVCDMHSARFSKKSNFSYMKVNRSALFQDAYFGEATDFRNAYFNTVFFQDELVEGEPQRRNTRFIGQADLRGFFYDRIHVDWKALFQAVYPYDRQPYTHLEKVYRTTGHDRQAELVYLARRDRERKRFVDLGQRSRAVSEWFQWKLFNYGVRPFRLFWFSLLIITLGSLMFMQQGAVKPKDNKVVKQMYETSQKSDKDLAGQTETTQQRGETLQRTQQLFDQNEEEVSLPWSRAFGMSLRLFIPIVEIPSSGQWSPSEKPAPFFSLLNLSFAGYATLHRLAGAILVPLGIAALTGVLYRREKG